MFGENCLQSQVLAEVFTQLTIRRSIHLSFHLSVPASIQSPIHPSFHSFPHPSTLPSLCPSIRPLTHTPVGMARRISTESQSDMKVHVLWRIKEHVQVYRVKQRPGPQWPSRINTTSERLETLLRPNAEMNESEKSGQKDVLCHQWSSSLLDLCEDGKKRLNWVRAQPGHQSLKAPEMTDWQLGWDKKSVHEERFPGGYLRRPNLCASEVHQLVRPPQRSSELCPEPTCSGGLGGRAALSVSSWQGTNPSHPC